MTWVLAFLAWVGVSTLALAVLMAVWWAWRWTSCRLGRHALVECIDWEDGRPAWVRQVCAYCDHEAGGWKLDRPKVTGVTTGSGSVPSMGEDRPPCHNAIPPRNPYPRPEWRWGDEL